MAQSSISHGAMNDHDAGTMQAKRDDERYAQRIEDAVNQETIGLYVDPHNPNRRVVVTAQPERNVVTPATPPSPKLNASSEKPKPCDLHYDRRADPDVKQYTDND